MKEAKIKYNHGSFEIIEEGDYVIFYSSGKKNY